MPVVGAVVSDTAARFDWWLQVHTVVTNVTSKVSLQAWHNWTAVCCFALSKVVISTKAVHVLVALWTWLYTAVLEDHVTEYGISFHAFANDTQLYIACCQHLLPANTRGNHYKLQNHTFHYDLRKHFFSARIVNIWNSLPNSVVDARTVNAFKARLDKFWKHQSVKFDFTADLTGTGNRSEEVIKWYCFVYDSI